MWFLELEAEGLDLFRLLVDQTSGFSVKIYDELTLYVWLISILYTLIKFLYSICFLDFEDFLNTPFKENALEFDIEYYVSQDSLHVQSVCFNVHLLILRIQFIPFTNNCSAFCMMRNYCFNIIQFMVIC